MGGRGAIAAAVAVWLGVLLGTRLTPLLAAGSLALALLFVGFAWRAPPRTGAVAATLALLLAACARGAGHRAVLERERQQLARAGDVLRIEARVHEPPPREAGQPVALVAVTRSRPPVITGTRLRVRLPAASDAEWSDVVDATVRVDLPRPARNPGGLPGRAVSDAAAVAASGRAFYARARPAGLASSWPRVTVARWRRAIERRLDAGLSAEARELVVPLVIGDRSGLSTDLYADLRASGLIHLIALSGLHVVWLASLARALVASLGGGVGPRALAAALCAVFYAGIAGPIPSLLRAAAHECLMAGATLRGRALDPVQALSLSALGLLAAAPGWAADLGFQLSFAATLGLVTFGPWLTERARAWRGAAAPFIPTLSTQATALPILLLRFHAVSWAGTFANLAAVPVSGFLLASAWLGTVTELILPGWGRLWFSAGEVLAAALRWIAVSAAAAPSALWTAGAEGGVVACALIGVALLALSVSAPRSLLARRRPESPARAAARLLGAIFLGVALACVLTVRPLAPPPGRAWLVALDVGQGDALALAVGPSWWLLDAGPRGPGFDAGEAMVLPFFRWAGVRRLEWLLVTHEDSDHAGGAGAVLRGLRVERVGASAARLGAPGLRTRPLGRGEVLRRDPLVRVLWPPHASPADAGNATALVIEAGRGASRLLFMADVDSTVEDSLDVPPGVLILKVAHHGAPSSTGTRFLRRARPAIALLSVGANNRFGHPAPALLARLAAAGAVPRRTDREGALWFEWSEAGARELDWRRDRPGALRSEHPPCVAVRAPRQE